MTDVVFSPRALCQVDEATDWWLAHRPSTGSLFLDELDRATELLADNPEIGPPYPRSGSPAMRRLILIRTRYHVYYEYHSDEDVVWVMDVWSAVRGEDPPL